MLLCDLDPKWLMMNMLVGDAHGRDGFISGIVDSSDPFVTISWLTGETESRDLSEWVNVRLESHSEEEIRNDIRAAGRALAQKWGRHV